MSMDLHLAARDVGEQAKALMETYDRAHAAGFAIPAKAVEALETIAALAVAWGHNAAGLPCPPDARKALGLPPIPTPDPAQLTIEENPA